MNNVSAVTKALLPLLHCTLQKLKHVLHECTRCSVCLSVVVGAAAGVLYIWWWVIAAVGVQLPARNLKNKRDSVLAHFLASPWKTKSSQVVSVIHPIFLPSTPFEKESTCRSPEKLCILIAKITIRGQRGKINYENKITGLPINGRQAWNGWPFLPRWPARAWGRFLREAVIVWRQTSRQIEKHPSTVSPLSIQTKAFSRTGLRRDAE